MHQRQREKQKFAGLQEEGGHEIITDLKIVVKKRENNIHRKITSNPWTSSGVYRKTQVIIRLYENKHKSRDIDTGDTKENI